MNKLILTAFALLAATASAQQKLPVTFTPVTIDGVTTPNGLITVNGKSYVSVDALKARGMTVLKTGSFGLYRFPNAQGQPVKLQGCMNEWLFNGVDRLRIDSAAWNETQKRYAIRFTMQTPLYNRWWPSHFGDKTATVVYSSGKIVQPSKNPIQRIEWDGDEIGDPETGKNNTGTLWVIDPDDTGRDTLTKLVVPTGTDSDFGSNVMSFDLTCKK